MEKVNDSQNSSQPAFTQGEEIIAASSSVQEGVCGGAGITDLSVIILSYKSKEHLQVLLPSIYSSRGIIFGPLSGFLPQGRGGYAGEVIVVDNDSRDGTAEWVDKQIQNPAAKCQNLQLIRNRNNGFAAGNNAGIRRALGRYILLLNPDTRVEPDTFKVMLDFMESHPEAGISGCKVVKPDGSLDLACRRRFPNPWNSFLRLTKISDRGYNLTDADPDRDMEIDSVMGAFLLIRKSVTDKIGLLDEAFFMYGEDLDWCWRCKEAGYKVWYYPYTFITHYKGASSKKTPFRALKWFHEAMWIFYKKHYWKKYPKVLGAAVWLGIQLRLWGLLTANSLKRNPVVSK